VVNASRAHFRAAARHRLEEAVVLLTLNGGRPQVAAYLGHVSMECALKLRMLVAANARDVTRFRELQGELADQMFHGSVGHNIASLAHHARLTGFLTARRQTVLLGGPVWRRVCGERRPYSLRYGVERPSAVQARDEIELIQTIVGLILEEIVA